MDPWLVEELIFAGQAWLYRGKKTHIPPLDLGKVVEGVDALILSQASLKPHLCLMIFWCSQAGYTISVSCSKDGKVLVWLAFGWQYVQS